MPNPTNSKEPAKVTLKDLHSIKDVTLEMLENVDKSDRGKMIQLVLDTPEAKKLVEKLKELQKTAEKSGLKLEDQLIIGDQSLRELTNNQTDTAKNEETLLQFAALHIGAANQKKLPSTFICPVADDANPEVNVDMSNVSSFGEVGKDNGIIAAILALLSKILNLFQKSPEQVKEDHNKKVDNLRMANLREYYLNENEEKFQKLQEEIEKAEKARGDQENVSQKDLEDLYEAIEKISPGDESIDAKNYEKMSEAISRFATPDITKKILRAAPVLRNLSADDFYNMKESHRRQAMLAKFQLELFEGNINLYKAAKDNKFDDVCKHGIALMDSQSHMQAVFSCSKPQRFGMFYSTTLKNSNKTAVERMIHPDASARNTRSTKPITATDLASLSIVSSNAVFKHERIPLSAPWGFLKDRDIPRCTDTILRSANEAAAKQRAMEAPNKEEIQKKAPEPLSGPMA